jgi:hypothetical protein
LKAKFETIQSSVRPKTEVSVSVKKRCRTAARAAVTVSTPSEVRTVLWLIHAGLFTFTLVFS